MKKGFTLIELLAVIVILGLIAVIVMPTIDQFIRNSQQTSFDSQVKSILEGAKNWSADNYDSLPANNGESITITLSQLQSGDYVIDNIKNPKTNEPFSSKSLITITNNNGEYIYKFTLSTTIDPKLYTITIAGVPNGVSLSKNNAAAGEQIQIVVATGYTVIAAQYNGISITYNGGWYFTMPEENVTVTVTVTP